VRVLEAEAVVELLAPVGAAVAVGVGESARSRESKTPGPSRLSGHTFQARLRTRQREHADRDVQPVGEDGDLPRAPVRAEVRKDAHRVEPVFRRFRRRGGRTEREVIVVPVLLEACDRLAERVTSRRPGVERRARDPDAAGGVKRDVQRLLEVGLAGDELHFEPGRNVKQRALLRRRTQPRVGRVAALGERGCSGHKECSARRQPWEGLYAPTGFGLQGVGA
jgi:hypothetical protein